MAGLIAQDRAMVGEGGRQLGAAMKDMANTLDQFKQLKENAKAADLIYKNNPEAAKMLAASPDEWGTLGAREKAGRVSSMMKAQGQMELMAKLGEEQARRKGEADFGPAASLFAEMAQADKFFGREFDPTAALGAVAAKYPEAARSQSFAEFARLAQQTGDPMEAQKLALEQRRLDIQERGIGMEGRRADIEERRLAGEGATPDEPKAKWKQNGVEVEGTLSQYEAAQAAQAKQKRDQDIAALQKERQEMEAKIAAGDDRYGWNQSRRKRVEEIDRQLGQMGAKTGSAPAAGKGGGKTLDKATAAALLQEAGGDKERARKLARERGYSF
jgi:hypothetical protein